MNSSCCYSSCSVSPARSHYTSLVKVTAIGEGLQNRCKADVGSAFGSSLVAAGRV